MGNASSVPDDVLAKAAAYVSSEYIQEYWHVSNRKQFLNVRATSRRGRDVVQHAVAAKQVYFLGYLQFHPVPHVPGASAWPRETRSTHRHIEMMARVFGPGCTSLRTCGISPRRIEALQGFAAATRGSLKALSLYASNVTPAIMVQICRHAPKLTSLKAAICHQIPEAEILTISALCPLLRQFEFKSQWPDSSPMERWAMHFPLLTDLTLRSDATDRYQIGHEWNPSTALYRPTLLAGIAATARANTAATRLDLHTCHITRDVIDAIVGTPLGNRITALTEWEPDVEGNIEPDAILAAARGFPQLQELTIPKGSTMGGPGFYKTLMSVANLRELSIFSDDSTTDACITEVCAHSRLESLDLGELERLTCFFVNGILVGTAARTLYRLVVTNTAEFGEGVALRAADVLRLVRGCPELKYFDWHCAVELSSYAELRPETCAEISGLMKSRGGAYERNDY
jgi:hypothetical protein